MRYWPLGAVDAPRRARCEAGQQVDEKWRSKMLPPLGTNCASCLPFNCAPNSRPAAPRARKYHAPPRALGFIIALEQQQ